MIGICDALIVGAGPAGLATSRELSRAGVRHVVLERGDQIGQTWANLYDSLVLHTAKRLSALPGLPFPRVHAALSDRAGTFSTYLHRYADDVPGAVSRPAPRWRVSAASMTSGSRAPRLARRLTPAPSSSPRASCRTRTCPRLPVAPSLRRPCPSQRRVPPAGRTHGPAGARRRRREFGRRHLGGARARRRDVTLAVRTGAVFRAARDRGDSDSILRRRGGVAAQGAQQIADGHVHGSVSTLAVAGLPCCLLPLATGCARTCR